MSEPTPQELMDMLDAAKMQLAASHNESMHLFAQLRASERRVADLAARLEKATADAAKPEPEISPPPHLNGKGEVSEIARLGA